MTIVRFLDSNLSPTEREMVVAEVEKATAAALLLYPTVGGHVRISDLVGGSVHVSDLVGGTITVGEVEKADASR